MIKEFILSAVEYLNVFYERNLAKRESEKPNENTFEYTHCKGLQFVLLSFVQRFTFGPFDIAFQYTISDLVE